MDTPDCLIGHYPDEARSGHMCFKAQYNTLHYRLVKYFHVGQMLVD